MQIHQRDCSLSSLHIPNSLRFQGITCVWTENKWLNAFKFRPSLWLQVIVLYHSSICKGKKQNKRFFYPKRSRKNHDKNWWCGCRQLLARSAVIIPSKSPIADHSLILVRQDSELEDKFTWPFLTSTVCPQNACKQISAKMCSLITEFSKPSPLTFLRSKWGFTSSMFAN